VATQRSVPADPGSRIRPKLGALPSFRSGPRTSHSPASTPTRSTRLLDFSARAQFHAAAPMRRPRAREATNRMRVLRVREAPGYGFEGHAGYHFAAPRLYLHRPRGDPVP